MKIGKLIRSFIGFIKNASISIWQISSGIICTAAIIAAGAIALTIPFYGWYFSLIASVTISAFQHRINRFLLVAILLLYGPLIMLAGVLTIWQDFVIIAIIQGAICWVIFVGFFLLTWYFGNFKRRQNQAPQ
ncbi:MAG: hypothetical protein WC473_01465 [Patescibacteria group bacterium]